MLSLERFATIRAEIEGTRDRDRVLEAVGLIPREWLSIERHWLNAIAKEVAAGRTELSSRFLVSFSAALPEVSLGSESMALAPPAAATVEPAAVAAPAIADPPAVKRVLASLQVGSAPALRSPDVDRWSLEQYAALARELRAQPSDALGIMTRHGLVSAESRQQIHEVWRQRFEAEPDLRRSFDRMVVVASVAESRPDPDTTGEIDRGKVNEGLLSRGIPFAGNAPAVPPTFVANLEPQSGETLLADSREIHARLEARGIQVGGFAPKGPTKSLPFVNQPASPLPIPGPTTSAAAALQSGATVAGSFAARPSMPFARVGAPNPQSVPPGWTIARYAALCIDLHASGMPEERVLAMAQLTRKERLALDDYWQRRMLEDPALRLEWKAHADRRNDELLSGRRPT